MNPPMIPPTIPPMDAVWEVEIAGLTIDVLCAVDREDVTPGRFDSEAVITCEGMMTLVIIF